ncbi:WD-40 repeat-containing protein MSI4 [Striga hermonthica]|uniref:WD-40 repeat-containing protein MSI4 n=1 Tax=Striga hermonthica TaxID=68872 RepID=A0A9N7N7E8_STRHE|nr:WD-40 repeat-containing protein MSI4 [Striga hermonthica]
MKDRGAERSVEDRYTQWKSLVPVLYDWLANHNLVWPSLSCRWGPQVEQATYKNRQRLYLSEQTDGSVPNTLVIANVEVVKARVAAAEHIAQFNEESRSPFVKKSKTIIHPGEVNRIRELPQNSNIVATHTDSPDVLIWDVETQSNRQPVLGATPSRPDLILTGHKDNAEFALSMSPTEPFVLSGGKDKSVVLWSIQDHISSLAAEKGTQKSPGSKSVGSNGKPESTTVQARGIFHGHDDTVEDVQFNPSSAMEFCSVGDDSCLILWDARTSSSPVVKVEKAHNADLHCVDWNPNDINLILTGSADNTVRMYDRRNLTSGGVGSPVHIFEDHTAAVLCVQWSPAKASVFGSAAEDGILNIWDHAKVGKTANPAGNSGSPPGLFFKHAGHRDKVVDFHWNAADPWTIVSVSEDGEKTGGGGTLQIWRMIDLIYRPEDESKAIIVTSERSLIFNGSRLERRRCLLYSLLFQAIEADGHQGYPFLSVRSQIASLARRSFGIYGCGGGTIRRRGSGRLGLSASGCGRAWAFVSSSHVPTSLFGCSGVGSRQWLGGPRFVSRIAKGFVQETTTNFAQNCDDFHSEPDDIEHKDTGKRRKRKSYNVPEADGMRDPDFRVENEMQIEVDAF